MRRWRHVLEAGGPRQRWQGTCLLLFGRKHAGWPESGGAAAVAPSRSWPCARRLRRPSTAKRCPVTSTKAPIHPRIRLSRKVSKAPTKRSRTSTATDPDVAKARQFLTGAGVPIPVVLNLQYNPDHYGVSSSEEYAALKNQLDRVRPVPGESAVHRMGDLHRRTREGRVPDLPAGLVPGLPGRRQLPDAVLHAGQLHFATTSRIRRSPASSPPRRPSRTRRNGPR